MRKLLLISLVFGLYLFGSTPALAAKPQADPVYVVSPEGEPISDDAAAQVTGEGGFTIATGIHMTLSGIKDMAEAGKRGDWVGFALAAGEYLLGKATIVIGVVTGPATP